MTTEDTDHARAGRQGRRAFIVTIMLLMLVVAGCTRPYDPCRGNDSPRHLDVVITPRSTEEAVVFTFTCETENAAYPIDRYSFALAFPHTNIIKVLPDPANLSTASGGSVAYHVTEGLHHRWHASMASPESDEASFEVTWKGWDPSARQNQSTHVEVRWTPSGTGADQAGDPLPEGLYGIRVGLRDGHDRTRWTVIEHTTGDPASS